IVTPHNMEKASRKLLCLFTFWLFVTGFHFMSGIAEARGSGSAQGPPSCNFNTDCQPWCTFWRAGSGACISNSCKCVIVPCCRKTLFKHN
ncbi:hypothetical protein A4A49_60346, partial [Nicotiana attenuata]